MGHYRFTSLHSAFQVSIMPLSPACGKPKIFFIDDICCQPFYHFAVTVKFSRKSFHRVFDRCKSLHETSWHLPLSSSEKIVESLINICARAGLFLDVIIFNKRNISLIKN